MYSEVKGAQGEKNNIKWLHCCSGNKHNEGDPDGMFLWMDDCAAVADPQHGLPGHPSVYGLFHTDAFSCFALTPYCA